MHQEDKLKTTWSRYQFLLARNEEEVEGNAKGPFVNSQSSTYMVGPLLLHTISSRAEDAVRKYRVPEELKPKVFEISPSQAAEVTLDPAVVLDAVRHTLRGYHLDAGLNCARSDHQDVVAPNLALWTIHKGT